MSLLSAYTMELFTRPFKDPIISKETFKSKLTCKTHLFNLAYSYIHSAYRYFNYCMVH